MTTGELVGGEGDAFTHEGVFIVAGLFLIAVSLLLRWLSFPVATSDYTGFLAHWFTALEPKGLGAFALPFADYAPLYLYLIKALTFLPFRSLYSIKGLSVAFDVVIAFFTYRIVRVAARASPAQAFLSAAVMFIIPTLLINSSLWGQSDAIYAAGVVASFYYLLQRKPLPAVVAFSLAFSVKVQAVFFLPVLVGYLFRQWRTLSYLCAVPLIFFVTLLPAIVAGGHLSYWGLIYLKEAAEYPYLSVSSPSIFAFFNNLSATPWAIPLFDAGVVCAGLVSVAVAAYVARKEHLIPGSLTRVATLCVLVVPYLLPRMHERYFYLADVFSVLYALCSPRQWYIPALVVLSSFLSYLPYLSQVPLFAAAGGIDLRIPSAFLFVALFILLYRVFRYSRGFNGSPRIVDGGWVSRTRA